MLKTLISSLLVLTLSILNKRCRMCLSGEVSPSNITNARTVCLNPAGGLNMALVSEFLGQLKLSYGGVSHLLVSHTKHQHITSEDAALILNSTL